MAHSTNTLNNTATINWYLHLQWKAAQELIQANRGKDKYEMKFLSLQFALT